MDHLIYFKNHKYLFAEIFFCCIWFTLAGINGMVDTDIFYMIPTGRYILAHGIPHINPFITTDGVPIVIQNWAYCVMIAWVEQVFGSVGLFMMTILMVGGLYLVVRKLVMKTIHNPWIAVFCSVILTYIFGYLNLRPEILTFFLICLELYGVTKYQQSNKKGFLWMLPLTLLAEINFHASYWIMHYIVLLPYLVSFPCKRVEQTCMIGMQRKLLIIVAVISLPVLLLNPYGMGNVTYVFDALVSGAFSLMKINELQPLTINNLLYVLPILFSIILFIFGLQKSGERPDSGSWIKLTSTGVWMWGGFLILVIGKTKWYPFFMLGTLYLSHDTGSIAEDILLKVSKYIRLDKITRFVLMLCVVALLIEFGKNAREPMTLIIKNQPLTDLYFSRYAGTDILDDWREVREIVKNDVDSSICSMPPEFNHFFEYEGCQVYIDMRPELYISSGSNGGGSVIGNMAALNNMQKNAVGAPTHFPFKNKEEKDAAKKEIQGFLSIEEYENLVDGTLAHYFLLANAYRGGVLRLFLEEHDNTYEKIYEGKNMTLFMRK